MFRSRRMIHDGRCWILWMRCDGVLWAGGGGMRDGDGWSVLLSGGLSGVWIVLGGMIHYPSRSWNDELGLVGMVAGYSHPVCPMPAVDYPGARRH